MAQNSNNLPICARGLVKRFGVIKAVSNIDLNLAPGEALGLLGPNGAGKTTSSVSYTHLTLPTICSV